ncbi:MAG TPA: hypothetical protein VMR17_04560 [Xanthobacteraceae bacterium]|nr:hypothetical protein [Xanthobacteraceae bacterium]
MAIVIGVAVGYVALARWMALPPFHRNNDHDVSIIRARALPARSERLPIEWQFGPPYSIFDYDRSNGETWIKGFEIRAKNRTGETLERLRADIRADRDNRDFELNLAIGDVVVDLGKSQDFDIAPGEEMRLVAPLPAIRDSGPEGIPADEIVNHLGGLTFTFRSRGADVFSKYFSPAEVEEQVSRIKQQSWKPQ